MTRPFEVLEEIEKFQKRYFLWALLFASIFAGLAIVLALILPSENAGIWKLVLPAALGAGGIGGQFYSVYRLLHESGPLKDLREYHKKLISEPSQISADVLFRVRNMKEYNRLFEGFTECSFIGYQAPFELEKEEHRKRVYKGALKTQLKRYEEGVESRYLFLDRASYDRAVSFFKKLQERAFQKGVTLAGKIELRCLPEQSSPTYTYFCGKRGKKRIPDLSCIQVAL